jgi:hypothetical protein
MDIHKTYKNAKLELRRQSLIAIDRADEALRSSKSRQMRVPVAVRLALKGGEAGPIGAHVASRMKGLKYANDREAFGRLLTVAADRSSLLDTDWPRAYLDALRDLARYWPRWIRDPESWKAGSHNEKRQWSSLCRHLLARYKVPWFFDSVWDRVGHQPCHCDWFIHVAQGGNLRKAEGLPIPLTKMMAHHVMEAPDECSMGEAIRYGQARGSGSSERLARALLGTRIGGTFGSAEVEAFWESVLRWLIQHPMIDPAQIGPIIDYLHHQKFVPGPPERVDGVVVRPGPPQPGLSMKGRPADALMNQVQAWHRRLNRTKGVPSTAWNPSGISEYERLEGEPPNERLFTITELLTGEELRAEGSAMKHCVGSYANSCASGRTAIFSMQVDGRRGRERMLTIEVDVRNRQIVQARGRFNAAASPLDQRVMNGWATTAGLTMGRFVLVR